MKPDATLKDIRYYESAGIPGPGRPIPTSSGDLVGIPKAAHRIGERISCLLHSEGFSVGSYHHVYVAFTPAIPEGEVVPTDFGLEGWQRYVAYGVSPGFRSFPEEEKHRVIEAATFQILEVLNPAGSLLLDRARNRIAEAGSRTRILRMSKESKRFHFEVWFDVPAWRELAFLYVTSRDKITGEVLEAPPYPLLSHEDAFPLVASVTFSKDVLSLNPRKSVLAGFSTAKYKTPIQFPLSQFVAPTAD